MNPNARELAASFDLEKLTGEFYANPYPTYRALREHVPVKRLPNGSYFLTRYNDLVAAYKNTKLFSSDKKKEFAPKYGDSLLYEHHTTSLVFNDPPAHTRVRRLIMGALSPRAIAGMEPNLIKLVDVLTAFNADPEMLTGRKRELATQYRQALLRSVSVGDVVRAGDTARLTRIPGIGKKTAERIVLELRDKLEAIATAPAAAVVAETR